MFTNRKRLRAAHGLLTGYPRATRIIITASTTGSDMPPRDNGRIAFGSQTGSKPLVTAPPTYPLPPTAFLPPMTDLGNARSRPLDPCYGSARKP